VVTKRKISLAEVPGESHSVRYLLGLLSWEAAPEKESLWWWRCRLCECFLSPGMCTPTKTLCAR
jgi:hypothetical protein